MGSESGVADGDERGTQGAGAPTADLKTFQTQAEGAKLGVELDLLHAQGGSDVAAETVEGAAVAEGVLAGWRVFGGPVR